MTDSPNQPDRTGDEALAKWHAEPLSSQHWKAIEQSHPKLHKLINELQGFGIDTWGDRFAPYQVIRQDLEDEKKFMDLDVVKHVVEALDLKLDRKLATVTHGWQRPAGETALHIPDRYVYNLLKLASMFSIPSLLGKPIRELYEREMQQPLLDSAGRQALLSAMIQNQRGEEYLPLWKEIMAKGHTENGYFIAFPHQGLQGALHTVDDPADYDAKAKEYAAILQSSNHQDGNGKPQYSEKRINEIIAFGEQAIYSKRDYEKFVDENIRPSADRHQNAPAGEAKPQAAAIPPWNNKPPEDPEVEKLVNNLQGFRIDLFVDRFSPYEVLLRKTLDHHETPEAQEANKEVIEANQTKLAQTLAKVLDMRIDDKLATSSYDWPNASVEFIQLPECLLYNALRLAASLGKPEILGDSVHAVLEREQARGKQPFFRQEIRNALLDAMSANQRSGEYTPLWEQIAKQGRSADGYFISSPDFGERVLQKDQNISTSAASITGFSTAAEPGQQQERG